MLKNRDTNYDDQIVTRLADFNNPSDTSAIVDLIDHYAQDPMGGGKPLLEEVRQRMTKGMAKMPGSFVVLASI